MKFRTCPDCGRNNDHGESCECKSEVREADATPEPRKRPAHASPYERTRAAVYSTGNKWAIENFHATHD
jgi:hypothetical protein